eukprot:SAG22_NODE_295_length_12850_cov_9.179202_4_plen_516_part_00
MSSKSFPVCVLDHEGIDKCQHNYLAAAQALGVDPASGAAVACHIFDKKYSETLYSTILDDGERSDVDYWWEDYGIDFNADSMGKQSHIIDCKNSSKAHCMHCIEDDPKKMPALWSAYVRHSRKTQTGKRGMVLEYYGGLGHHRYPLVGSGDTYEAWQTLSFEVTLSISAANVGVAWTHDLGAFMSNIPGTNNDYNGKQHDQPELYLRWLQYGAWSSVFRVHCSHCEPRPWVYPNSELLFAAYRLRNNLVPYIYTAAWKASRTGVLLVHPLYYDFPEEEEAYSLSTYSGPNATLQYCFGDAFVVAPITQQVHSGSGLVAWETWVPPGQWVDWQTGDVLVGPRTRTRQYGLEETPVLARAGAVVPMKGFADSQATSPSTLVVAVAWAAGASGSAELYEDNGGDFGHEASRFRLAVLEQNTTAATGMLPSARRGNATETVVRIRPAVSGAGFRTESSSRSYLIRLRNAPQAVAGVTSPQWPHGLEHWYENEAQLPHGVLVVQTPPISTTTPATFRIEW